MKKCFAVLLALGMLAALLSGCMYEKAETRIDADGSGSVTVTFGFSEELVETCGLYQEIEEASFTPFTYNGRTYYGDSATEAFSDPGEFNAIFAQASDSAEDSGAADMGTVTLSRGADGSLTLTFLFGGETGAADALEKTVETHAAELTAAQKAALLDGMVALYEFTFPGEIRQRCRSTYRPSEFLCQHRSREGETRGAAVELPFPVVRHIRQHRPEQGHRRRIRHLRKDIEDID